MYLKRFIISLIIVILCNLFAIAQQTNSVYSGNSVQLIPLCDTAWLFQQDTINELWIKDKSLDSWKLDEFTEIFTYDNNRLRIWQQKEILSLWFYADKLKDWQVYDKIRSYPVPVNDTISYINVDDSTVVLNVNDFKSICYRRRDVFVWDNKTHKTDYIINDSIQLQKVNDTVVFWKNVDSTVLWNLNTRHTYWQVTTSTKVWTVDKLTEFWKAGDNYKLWRRKNIYDKWLKDDSTTAQPLDSLSKYYWNINKTKIIVTDKDSTQIWEADANKSMWNIRDSLYLWEIILPKTDTISQDTVAEEVLREIKTAELFRVSEKIKLWQINDSVEFCLSDNYGEIWHTSKQAKLWKLNDSSLIWNINEKLKLSIISNKMTIWKRNDSTFVWEIDSTVHNAKFNHNFMILNLTDSTRFTVINDSTRIWHVYTPTKVSALGSVAKYLTLHDTIEIWEPNDSTKLFINKYEEQGNIWVHNKRVNILNINDTTKIWQINKDVRLSIIKNKLKIWQQGKGDPYLSWKETKGFEWDIIADSIRMWHIDKNTIIWETKQKIQVWNKNNTQQLYRLNDTSLVWTYPKKLKPKKASKISYWKFSGSGKMDVAQMWADNWAKGAQNNITGLCILAGNAKYKKKKVLWTSDLTYHYGFIKAGEKPLRKNEDKIKISSNFNFYAAKNLYYSFSVTTQTQLFEGYKYEKDTSYLVSDWSAPLYHTMAIGLNYYPVKQLSVFFSPITGRITYVKDTSVINQRHYGIDGDKKFKSEPGIILKSHLNWNISKNISIVSKLDIFSSYKDIKTQNIEWETSFTFKFNNYISTRLHTNLIYDPDVRIKDDNGKSFTPVQFKEIISIGFFYKI